MQEDRGRREDIDKQDRDRKEDKLRLYMKNILGFYSRIID